MIDAISGPLWTAAQASGKIKTYMIIIALMILTNVPAAFIILYLGLSPVWLMVYKVVMNLMIHFTRIGYLHWLIRFPSLKYLKKVMLPISLYILIAAPVPFLISLHTETIAENLLLVLFTICECTAFGLLIMMNSNERHFFLEKIIGFLHLKRN